MVSSYTTSKGIEKPSSGSYPDAWAAPVNADWDLIDRCFGGVQALNAVAASGTVTLTATQYQPPIINITGLLTANVNYQLPSGVGGFWFINNGTTGAFTVTFSSAGGGTTVTLTQGARTACISDGTNVSQAFTLSPTAAGSNTYVQFNSSGVLSGSANFTWSGTVLGVVGNQNLKGTLQLQGSSSGGVSFLAPATGGTAVYTVPGTDGASGQVLSTNGAGALSWITVSGGGGSGVSSFSAGTTGLTPSVVTTGAIVLGGTLNVANGGTGATTLTGLLYGNGTSAVTGVSTIPISIIINGNAGVSLTVGGTNGTHSTKIADSATNSYNAGYLEVPQSGGAPKTVNYATVLSDSGKTIVFNGSALVGTIPANSSVAYPLGTTLTFVNLAASSPMTVGVATDTMYWAGSGTTGDRTLGQNGVATCLKVASTTWIISGVGLS